MAKKKAVSKVKAMSKEHEKEYAKYSPSMLKKHMKEEKILLKKKEKK
jgi:hypothetical protein